MRFNIDIPEAWEIEEQKKHKEQAPVQQPEILEQEPEEPIDPEPPVTERVVIIEL